jgi:hypothetical protein
MKNAKRPTSSSCSCDQGAGPCQADRPRRGAWVGRAHDESTLGEGHSERSLVDFLLGDCHARETRISRRATGTSFCPRTSERSARADQGSCGARTWEMGHGRGAGRALPVQPARGPAAARRAPAGSLDVTACSSLPGTGPHTDLMTQYRSTRSGSCRLIPADRGGAAEGPRLRDAAATPRGGPPRVGCSRPCNDLVSVRGGGFTANGLC